MQIFMATYGTRGDVQPLVALALGLEASGHRVTLAGPPEYQSWAQQLGCHYQPLGSDLRPFLARVKASHGLRSAAAFHQFVMQEAIRQFQELPVMIARWEAELVIGASLCLALPSVAEALKLPYRYIAFTPQMLPSGAHACPVFRRHNLPAWINRLGWQLDLLIQRFDLLPAINRQRRALNLVPLKSYWDHLLGDLLLLACDGELAPVPSDNHRPVAQTGYLHLHEVTELPVALEDFLNTGTKPFYAGFGSMPSEDAQRWIPMAIDAARACGQRLILKADEAIQANIPRAEDLFVGAGFAHRALFPRMRAVIHHGGAGTTAAAARSGMPQIIVPHILDQYYWGEQIFRRGIGPPPIWRSRLTVQRLKSAMQRCLRDAMIIDRAQAVGERIGTRAPVPTAVRVLEKGLSTGSSLRQSPSIHMEAQGPPRQLSNGGNQSIII